MGALRSIGVATVILVVGGELAVSRAAEVCVVCTGPEAMYRCVVDTGLPDVTPSVRLLCISNIAADGKHETCAVSRTIGMATCNGPERHVKAGSLGTPPVADAPPVPTVPAAPAPEPPRERAQSQPAQPAENPATVQDMARQMAKSTSEQVEKAGSAISGAARKTWGCVSSFFKAC